MTSKTENLIHIKFEYGSGLEAKRDFLASEIDLLKISNRLKKYKESRLQELEIKEDMHRKLRALKLDIGRLQNLLPGIKIPKILKPETVARKKEKHEEDKIQEKVQEKPEGQDELEMELQSIQDRLASLK